MLHARIIDIKARAPALFKQTAQFAALLYPLTIDPPLANEKVVKTGCWHIESAAE